MGAGVSVDRDGDVLLLDLSVGARGGGESSKTSRMGEEGEGRTLIFLPNSVMTFFLASGSSMASLLLCLRATTQQW